MFPGEYRVLQRRKFLQNRKTWKKLTTTAMIAIVSYDGKSDHFEITKYLVFLERLTFGKWSRTSAYGVERIKA